MKFQILREMFQLQTVIVTTQFLIVITYPVLVVNIYNIMSRCLIMPCYGAN